MVMGAVSHNLTGYTIFLCIFCGLLLLLIDAKLYRMSSQKKESRVSRVFGWIHILLGSLLFVVSFLT
jgi:hypothetical protein